MAKIEYMAEDRSMLLPYYRRWLVTPLLRFLPASLSPNTITHAGHLFNLVGVTLLLSLWPTRGWPLYLASFTLQIYIWCDNADGAHARNTGQCSPYGELLDHGLDILNLVYIGYLTAFALGAPPIWWVVVSLAISGAGAVTYWEQTTTGVFRLGLINQVESSLLLSGVLIVSGVLGTGYLSSVSLWGLTGQMFFLWWTAITIAFGMVRNMMRVAKATGTWRSIAPVVALLTFDAMVIASLALNVIHPLIAVALATGGNIFFSMRMLATRLDDQASTKTSLSLVGSATALLVVVLWAWASSSAFLDDPPQARLVTAITLVCCALFAIGFVRNARKGVQLVKRLG